MLGVDGSPQLQWILEAITRKDPPLVVALASKPSRHAKKWCEQKDARTEPALSLWDAENFRWIAFVSTLTLELLWWSIGPQYTQLLRSEKLRRQNGIHPRHIRRIEISSLYWYQLQGIYLSLIHILYMCSIHTRCRYHNSIWITHLTSITIAKHPITRMSYVVYFWCIFEPFNFWGQVVADLLDD